MVKLFLLELTNRKVIYKYHPEGEADFGIIEIDRVNKTCKVVKKATKIPHSEYWGQALAKARKMLNKDEYPDFQMAAWY